jgi:polysaccharide export outer membrane protein
VEYRSFDTNILALLFAGILATGCGTMPPSSPPTSFPTGGPATSGAVANINRDLLSAAAQPSSPSADYRIGPEDMLQITLYNIPGSAAVVGIGGTVQTTEATLTPRTLAVRVSQTGVINLPLFGEVFVNGLTVSGLEEKLRQLYDKYIYNPQVGVLVTDYRQKASVIGAVHKPGELVISGPKTLIDVLAMAGGVTPAAGTQVHLYRRGPNEQESYVIDLLVLASNPGSYNDKNINQPIQAGDVVNVPQAGMFFVDGAVKTPGAYPLSRQYSLTQALATAGGVVVDFNSSSISIFRRKTGMEPMSFDLDAILAGSTSDPQIEADDVIVVPINTLKYVYFRVLGQIVGWSFNAAARMGH